MKREKNKKQSENGKTGQTFHSASSLLDYFQEQRNYSVQKYSDTSALSCLVHGLFRCRNTQDKDNFESLQDLDFPCLEILWQAIVNETREVGTLETHNKV